MADLGVKKQRNHLIDVLKVLFTIPCCLAHFSMFYPLIDRSNVPFSAILNQSDPSLGASYTNMTNPSVWGIAGLFSIGFFTTMTGYWFVAAFKRYQSSGVLNKGKNGTVLFKYWAKNYASYVPYTLFGTLWGYILYHATIPGMGFSDPWGMIGQFFTSIPQMLGINDLGFQMSRFGVESLTKAISLTDNFTISAESLLITWNSPLWYMFAIIALMGIWFAVFMTNETIGVSLFSVFTLWNYTIGLGEQGGMARYFSSEIPVAFDWASFCGPVAFGVWAWYLTDFIKKQKDSKALRRGMSIVTVLSFACIVYSYISNTGGMVFRDFYIAIFMVCVMSGKDSITPALNKICGHIPFIKYAASFSLGLYLVHWPVAAVMQIYILTNPAVENFFAGYSSDVVALMFIAVAVLLAIIFCFLDKHVLQKLTKWILNVTKANEPVVIEAPAEAK